MKKILTTGALLSIITPVAMTVSCGSKETTNAANGSHFIRITEDTFFKDNLLRYSGTTSVSTEKGFQTFDFNHEYNIYQNTEHSKSEIKINRDSIVEINAERVNAKFDINTSNGVSSGVSSIRIPYWITIYRMNIKGVSNARNMIRRSELVKLFNYIGKNEDVMQLKQDKQTKWLLTYEVNRYSSQYWQNDSKILPGADTGYGFYMATDATIDSIY